MMNDERIAHSRYQNTRAFYYMLNEHQTKWWRWVFVKRSWIEQIHPFRCARFAVQHHAYIVLKLQIWLHYIRDANPICNERRKSADIHGFFDACCAFCFHFEIPVCFVFIDGCRTVLTQIADTHSIFPQFFSSYHFSYTRSFILKVSEEKRVIFSKHR